MTLTEAEEAQMRQEYERLANDFDALARVHQQQEQELAAARRILTLLEGNSHVKFDMSSGMPLGRCVFCHFLFDLFSMKEEGPHHSLCPIGALRSYREKYPRAIPLQEEINILVKEQSDGK